MKLVLKRLGIVVLIGTLVCFPAALIVQSRLNMPLWYLLLSALFSAAGMALFACAFGGIALLAGRHRKDGGIKTAAVITALISLLASYAVISATQHQLEEQVFQSDLDRRQAHHWR